MTRQEPRADSPNRPVLLLAAQGFALALTVAWVTIPASAIFLSAYGSELLPVTYIGAAVAGVVSSTLLAAAFRRRPLASVATTTLAGLTIALLVSWLALSGSDADWISFALLVLVPIMVPVGFIFVVGQAGMLLDVRVLKVFYARVVAGFALGFVTGGLVGPPLLSLLGPTESLLAAAAAAAGLFLILVAVTRRGYPAELSVVEAGDGEHAGSGHTDIETRRPTLRALSRNRFVLLIVAFQMLSAVESQWLDFHVLATAAQRYDDSDALARFISQFSAIAYGTDIIFLLVLAGLLLHRFGLRYGLTANAVGVLILVVAVLVTTAFLGSGATLVFALIVSARVADLTFSDGTSRTSLSAAYQAVPTRMRPVAQATVEGLAVPVAIGVSGIVLLALQAAGGIEGLVLPVLTALVVSVWAVVAVRLYRAYRENLLANLRGRTLDPADLAVDEASSLIAIDRLVGSADERDVRLGLDILTIAEHPELPLRLQRLVVDERVNVRTDALERLVDVAPHAAAAAARTALADPSSRVRAASLRVLGAARDRSDIADIAARSDDPDPDVRVAAAFALSRVGDDTVRARLQVGIDRLARSELAGDRMVAALMLGAVETDSRTRREVLGALLGDSATGVVDAALRSLRFPEDACLISGLVAHLDDRQTAGAAIDALIRAGEDALAAIDHGLRGDEHGLHVQEMLARAAREIGGPAAIFVLRHHIEHPDREVGLAVMRALAVLGRAEGGAHAHLSGVVVDEVALTESVVREDLERAAHGLRALVAFEHEPGAAVLCAALRDELVLIRQRILAAFSMRHGIDGFNQVVFQLAQRDPHAHALALEWLDVTLSGTERAAVGLLEPRLSDRERWSVLGRTFPLPQLGRRDVMLELVRDGDRRWRRPWVTACAVYSASRISMADLEAVIAAAADATAPAGLGTHDPIVQETLTGIGSRRPDLV